METVEILFFISAFIAEIIGTIAGFGSSTIFLPLSLLFVDFRTAIILVVLIAILVVSIKFIIDGLLVH